MKIRVYVLAVVLVSGGLGSAACADPPADKEAGIAASQRGDYNAALRLFTRDLASAAPGSGDRGDLLVMRGFVYEQMGKYAQAIDDYSEVLNAKPDAVQVYFRRGVAYRDNGQYDHALTDLEAVVRSRSHPLPNFPFFFGERGVVNFALGRFADAAQDFARVGALDAMDQYGALWLYVARSRAGDPDAYELARASSRAHSDQWPHPLLRLYLGNATRAQVAAAASDADGDAREDQRCERDFFLGEYELLRGAEDMARKLFHDTTDACPATLSVHTGARSELNRIGG